MFYLVEYFNNRGFLDVRTADDPGFFPEGGFFLSRADGTRAGRIMAAEPTLKRAWSARADLYAAMEVLRS